MGPDGGPADLDHQIATASRAPARTLSGGIHPFNQNRKFAR
jgi:hypothetical protein